MENDVLVIGAGVMGLTTAVCLAEAGRQVTVWAEKLPEETTSAAASGLWVPGFTPRELAWSKVSYTEFSALAGQPGTGVHVERGKAVTNLWPERQPWFDEMPDLSMYDDDEVPEGMTLGWRASSPLVDLSVYFPYLTERLAAAGGHIERRRIEKLSEATDAAGTVVNCTGVGAGELAGDEGVLPMRGQHVIVRNPGVDYWYMEGVEAAEFTAFFPHGDRVLLGGVIQPGDWSLKVSEQDTAGILERCAKVEPLLAGAEVLGHSVGLRAGREEARLELEMVGQTRLVHCYGHASFGISQSWGSAREVQGLLSTAPDAG